MLLTNNILIMMYDIRIDRNIIYRSESLYYRTINVPNKSRGNINYANLKCNQLPQDLIHKLVDPSIVKICWDKTTTTTITKSLLSEIGNTNTDPTFIDIQELLYNNGYPYTSLNAIAKYFSISGSSRADVKNKHKLHKRFLALSKVVCKLIRIDELNLFDGIII